jgi:fibro-slime domain-containing protein
MKQHLLIPLLLMFLGLSGQAAALPIISLVPDSTIIQSGENLFIDVNVSGLQSGGNNSLLGAFSMDVLFNPELQFLPAGSGSNTWGFGLGDVDAGEALVGGDISQIGSGLFSFYEVSLIDRIELSALQNDSFRLATLAFYLPYGHSLASGSSINFSTANVVLSDDFGNELITGVNQGATVQVPEPPVVLLLLIGLLPIWIKNKPKLLSDVNVSAKKIFSQYKSLFAKLGACFLIFAATELNAAPQDCSGGDCSVSNPDASITVNPYSIPNVFIGNDGYLYKSNGGVSWVYKGVAQVMNQWHWFRLSGDSQERTSSALEDFDLVSATKDQDEGIIRLVYNFPSFEVNLEVIYSLAGTPSGHIMTKGVKITNVNAATPKDISWIEYSDFETSGQSVWSTQKNDFINTVVSVFDGNAFVNPITKRVVQFQAINPAHPNIVEGSAFGTNINQNGVGHNLIERLLDTQISDLIPTDFLTSTLSGYSQPKGIIGAQYEFANVTESAIVQTQFVARDSKDFTQLSGTIRDFTPQVSGTFTAHPDFENGSFGLDLGIVAATVGADKKPVYAGQPETSTTTGATNFNQWYRDIPTFNQSKQFSFYVEKAISNSPNVFTYVQENFFPIDNALIGNGGLPHNFHFTFETHTRFIYGGGEQLSYASDDDLWVFINGKLAVNLGGIHPANEATSTINLDALAALLGLIQGNAYDFDLFYADRAAEGSYLRFDIPQIADKGDLTGDKCIDKTDLTALLAVINGPNPKPAVTYHDLNGDGKVNVADSRKLVTLFTNPRGAACN